MRRIRPRARKFPHPVCPGKGLTLLNGAAPPTSPNPGRVRLALCAAAAMVAAVTALRLVTGRIWVSPDSAGYLTLAIGFAEHWDWSNPLLLFRLPGHPLLLAAVFATCGDASAVMLRIVQHVMVAGCAGLTITLARHLGLSRRWALAAGACVLLDPYLARYADAVLTEVPYTLLLLAWMVLLVRFLRSGNPRAVSALAGASVLAAMLALFKDAGLALLILGALAGLWASATHATAGLPGRPSGRGPRAFACIVAALIPGLILLAPVVIHNHHAFGYWGLNANGGMLPYYRAACVDRLPPPTTTAVARIGDMLTAARRAGVVGKDATLHDYLPTVRAVQHALDPTSRQIFATPALPQISALLGEAGWDIMRAHPLAIVRGTLRNSWHILTVPDPAGRMPHEAHADFVVHRVGATALARYIPSNQLRVDHEPAPLPSRPVENLANALYRRLEGPLPLLPISPYELLILLALAGSVTALAPRPQAPALLLLLVTAYHLVGAGFMGGLEPRYVVPLHPLLIVWAVHLASVVSRLFHAQAYTAVADVAASGASPGKS